MGTGTIDFHGLHQQTRYHPCQACKINGHRAAPEHMLSCASTRIRRHDAVVIAIQHAVRAAGVKSHYEYHTGPSQRIDLLLQHPDPPSVNQTKMMIDVTILESYTYKTDALPNTNLKFKVANANKIQKYKDVALHHNAKIKPLAFTTFGGMSYQTREFFKELQQMAIITGQYYPDIDRSFKVIWQENTAFALARATTNCACDAASTHRTRHDQHSN